MGILKPRKQPLSIRKVRTAMEHANKECHKQIVRLNNSQENCACPKCEAKEYVVSRGTNRKIRKFGCDNPCHKKRVCFSTSTSYEAIEIYREAMAKNLCQLVKANSVIGGINDINGTSKYFVELSLERLYEYIINEVAQPKIEIDPAKNIVAAFLDFSGSGLARNKAIILAKVDDKIIFEVVTTSNHLSAHQLLAAVKDRLKIHAKTKLVFVTDGEKCFVDTIRHFFPEAIHVRQFHKKSCKGMIYTHLMYEGKEYTIRCLWDAVLNEGTPSKAVLRKREQRAANKLMRKETANKIEYTELSKETMVWMGTVYEPRGVRRRLPKDRQKRKSKAQSRKRENTSPSDTPQLIFKGPLEKAKKLAVFERCFATLKKVFGGLHITSNVVENVFNVKTKFRPHRTMKFGERMLVCILYSNFTLKDLSKQELEEFLKERVVTYDFVRKKVLYGSGLQKNRPAKPAFVDVIKDALAKEKDLVIHYCDRNRKHTARIITPLRIMRNDYNRTTQIESFCHLRKDKRTFYVERIRDVAVFDPKPICF